ncbi:MAG: PASTA domain-containing protein [Lachnospiraceae bacterium]|nr:PASTA domain-containing protein [Lachnospiraceae bacterium]
MKPNAFSLSSRYTPVSIGDWSASALLEATLSTGQPATEDALSKTEKSSHTATDDDNILTMINMVGNTLEDATNALSQLDSTIQITTLQEYSDTYASGTVISQSIPDDTQFTKGRITNIVLTVSMGVLPATQAQTKKSSASSGNGSSDSDYKVNGSDGTTTKKDDGYTTIHLD